MTSRGGTSGQRPPGDPTPTPAGAATGPDVRLLLPALVAWASLAVVLTSPAGRLSVVAAVTLVAGVAGCVAVHRSAAPTPALVAGTMSALAVTLVVGAAAGHQWADRAGPVPEWAHQGAVVQMVAQVSTEPRLVAASRPGQEPLVVLRVRLLEVQGRGEQAQVNTPALVFADASWAAVRWRAQVSFVGRLSPAEPGSDVVVTVRTWGGPPSEARAPGPGLGLADLARERLREAVDGLPRDARGLVPGLVIGDTALTPPELTEAMLATGMTHLSAVSGSNVAIVVAAVMVVCGWSGVPRSGRAPIAILAIAGFVVLCRPEPSVLRAAVMGTIGLVALSSSRRAASMPALGAAILLLLCFDPQLARSYGFGLSCCATLGLIFFARPWGEAIAGLLPSRLRLLGFAVAVPLAAQVMCGPLVVLLQGQVQPVAVLANLVAAPLVPITTVAGVVAAVGALLWPPLGLLGAWTAALPGVLIGQVARGAAQLPGGSLPWLPGAAGAWVLTGLSLIVVLYGPRWWPMLRSAGRRARAALAAVVASAALAALATSLLPTPLPDSRHWVVALCDVGQGDALVLRSGPQRAVLIDTGPDPAALRSCLDSLRVEELDAVVLSHLHADHIGALPAVIPRLPVGEVWMPPWGQSPQARDEVLSLAASADVTVHGVQAGATAVWGQVSVQTWWPARMMNAGSVANNNSLVMTATVAGISVLLTGDIEPETQVALRSVLHGHSHLVLKVPHHGSAAQDEHLLRGVGAEIALIGVGADNSFGHPAPSLLRLLEESGMRVFRTDLHGTVVLDVRDGVVSAVTERSSPRRDGGPVTGGGRRRVGRAPPCVRNPASRLGVTSGRHRRSTPRSWPGRLEPGPGRAW